MKNTEQETTIVYWWSNNNNLCGCRTTLQPGILFPQVWCAHWHRDTCPWLGKQCGIRISCCATYSEHLLEHWNHVLSMISSAIPLCENDHEEAKHTHELPGKESSCAHLMLEIMPCMAALTGITKYLWLAADKGRKWNNSSFTCTSPFCIFKGVLQDLKRIGSTEIIKEIYRRKWKSLVTSELLYLNAIFFVEGQIFHLKKESPGCF